MMTPPKFWEEPDGATHLASRILSPLGKVYASIVAAKIRHTKPHTVSCPVLCIGNVSLGGVGKTPFVDLLCKAFSNNNISPHILMRGYGGKQKGPMRVGDHHHAGDVGDEAKMLSRHWPVWISSDRPAGARLAAAAGADLIIMDDGFQNPSLYKDYTFVLVDAKVGLGNGQVFPAGPLRETPTDAFTRCDCLVVVGDDPQTIPCGVSLPKAMPILRATLRADISALDKDKPVVAFAGIGRPQKYFDGLIAQGINVVSTFSFPDHHRFSEDDIEGLRCTARLHEANLVTTEKDFARLHHLEDDDIIAVPAVMTVEMPELLARIIAPVIARIPKP